MFSIKVRHKGKFSSSFTISIGYIDYRYMNMRLFHIFNHFQQKISKKVYCRSIVALLCSRCSLGSNPQSKYISPTRIFFKIIWDFYKSASLFLGLGGHKPGSSEIYSGNLKNCQTLSENLGEI